MGQGETDPRPRETLDQADGGGELITHQLTDGKPTGTVRLSKVHNLQIKDRLNLSGICAACAAPGLMEFN